MRFLAFSNSLTMRRVSPRSAFASRIAASNSSKVACTNDSNHSSTAKPIIAGKDQFSTGNLRHAPEYPPDEARRI